jgi:hypothetical protein
MTGTDLLTAMIGLVSRNRRRYGGYIVHAGMVLIFLGFAGQGFSRDQQLLLKPGQEQVVGDYTIHLDAIRVTDDGQKQMITGHITVKNAKGEVLEQMRPAKWYFRKHEEEPTTEVAIRRTFAEDLYIVMAAYAIEEQTASVEGTSTRSSTGCGLAGILAIGTGIAPAGSIVVVAAAKLPAEVVTASVILLSILLSSGTAFAQRRTARITTAAGVAEAREVAISSRAGAAAVRDCRWAVLVRHVRIERSNIDGMLKEADRGSDPAVLRHHLWRQPGAERAADQRIRRRGLGDADRVGVGGFLTIAYWRCAGRAVRRLPARRASSPNGRSP